MDVLHVFESNKNPTEILNPRTLGLNIEPSMMQVSLMSQEYTRAGYDKASIFVDICKKDKWYLIIYLWKPYNITLPHPFKCFYCSPGYRLAEEEEAELLHYCTDKNTHTNKLLIEEVVRTLQRLAPDLNLIFYSDRPLYSVLHIYFCMFRGLRELLFKAGLPYLAVAIDKVDSYNMMSAKESPNEFFEKGFTVRLLRMLDNEWGIRDLLDVERRQIALKTYKKFCQALVGYDQITCSQWEYLKSCCQGKFDYQKEIFHFLKAGETERLYEDFEIFTAKCKLINKYMHWSRRLTSVMDLQLFMYEADHILLYVTNQEEWDRLMWKQARRLRYLDYQDKLFFVTHSTTVKEIFEEANIQENCLSNMFEEIARGDRDIGYIRSVDKPDRTLVTFEVSDGKVRHLWESHNVRLEPDSPEFQWLTRVYIKEKGFELSDKLARYYDPDKFEVYREALGNAYDDVLSD